MAIVAERSMRGKRFTLPLGTRWAVDESELNRARVLDRISATCACGTVKSVLVRHLVSGASLSCGCLQRELAAARQLKHGAYVAHRPSAEYRTWLRIVQRCHNKNSPDYADYGSRGIVVCSRWREHPEAFLADMGLRPADTSIDRIDNDRGYSCGKCEDCAARGEPANCRWATDEQQAGNRRSCIMITHGAETLTAAEWGRRTGIDARTIRARMRLGWSGAEAVSLRPKPGGHHGERD